METSATPALAQRRRQRHREEARRTILDAAERLLHEEGLDRFSMRRLAARCGYTAPTIYHYFADKPGLLDALLETYFAKLCRELARVPRGAGPHDHLRELIVCWVGFGRANPEHYRLVTASRNAGQPVPPSGQKALDLFEPAIRELEARGEASRNDGEVLQQAMWALVHGLISLTTSRPDYPWVPTLDAFAIEAMLRGLREARGALS